LKLQSLNLTNTRVTDVGLKGLATQKNLATLSLWGTAVTDAGVKDLAGLKNLTTLDLRGTGVTIADLKDLAGLKNLTTLDLGETTDATLRALREIGLLHTITQATAKDGSRPKSPDDIVK